MTAAGASGVVGFLTGGDGTRHPLERGRPIEVSGLIVVPAWSGALELVCVVPPAVGLWVESGGMRRTGAFLLRPRRSFEVAGRSWRFDATPAVAVAGAGRCALCRSAFGGDGFLFSVEGPEPVRGEVLCRACAGAFGQGGA